MQWKLDLPIWIIPWTTIWTCKQWLRHQCKCWSCWGWWGKWRAPANFTQVVPYSFVFSTSLTVFYLFILLCLLLLGYLTDSRKKKKRKILKLETSFKTKYMHREQSTNTGSIHCLRPQAASQLSEYYFWGSEWGTCVQIK